MRVFVMGTNVIVIQHNMLLEALDIRFLTESV